MPGEATVSGKPYIGRTNNLKRRMRECKDGRDRTKAIIIDHYDPNIPKDGAIKEQKAINKYSRGKLNNLDNKRNEIKKSYWAKYGIE